MNFICSITHTLIKKSNPVRIFFIESHEDPVFPFMNYNQATSTGHFMPAGCAFKGKFADDDHNEYFTFNLDNKESPLVDGLLKYINKNSLTKKEAEEKGFLSHNSKDILWGEITSLEELFHRARDSSVILKSNYNKDNPFISVMVMHESAYQMMLKHADKDSAVERLKTKRKEKDFSEHKTMIEKMIKKTETELNENMGQTHKAKLTETVLIDDEIINICIDELKEFNWSKDSRFRKDYLNSIEKLKGEMGSYKKMSIRKERLIDEDYIKWFIGDMKRTFLGFSKENDLLKDSAFNPNSKNFVASLQVEEALVSGKWQQPSWSPILEVYLIEDFMTSNGYEFLPSRRHYQYQPLNNKAFFKDLTNLPLYK